MHPALDLTGSVLDHRYRIIKLLGEGGMAFVYEAHHAKLGHRVAVKVLHPRFAYDARFRERFLQEARVASTIQHPNVVQIKDFGDTPDGSVYYVMEYLEGHDVETEIERHGPIPWPRARSILLQAASALQAAHVRHIIHRDIKPANCFLTSDPHTGRAELVKLLDFGIAKVGADSDAGVHGGGLTGTGEVFGTAAYMAPEQARGEPLDVRSDVYSLGIMAYEMLTGHKPFDGSNSIHIITKHLNEPPPPLRTHVPDAPEVVEALVLTMLAKARDDRFSSMAALEQALLGIPEDAWPGRQARDPRFARTVVPGMAPPASGPMPAPGSGSRPAAAPGPATPAAAPPPAAASGSMAAYAAAPPPAAASGPMAARASAPPPAAASGPMMAPAATPPPAAASGPMAAHASAPPAAASGPMAAHASAPPAAASGPMAAHASATPAAASGPMAAHASATPAAASGPMAAHASAPPAAASGPMMAHGSGPMPPAAASGPMAAFASEPMPAFASEPMAAVSGSGGRSGRIALLVGALLLAGGGVALAVNMALSDRPSAPEAASAAGSQPDAAAKERTDAAPGRDVAVAGAEGEARVQPSTTAGDPTPPPEVQPTPPADAPADDAGAPEPGDPSLDEPLDADEPDEPADDATPSSNSKTPDYQTQRCAQVRTQADAALEGRKWSELLDRSKQRRCWSSAGQNQRRRFMVRALLELGRFEDCLSAGKRATDAETARMVEICRKRAK